MVLENRLIHKYIPLETQDQNAQLLNLYQEIYSNVDTIYLTHRRILDPQNNTVTQRHLNEGYSFKEAVAFSYMITFIFYLQILGNICK
jgi:hypothetical protein